MFPVLRDVIPQLVYPKIHDPLISTKKKEKKKRSRNQVDEIKKIMSKLHHHCL